MYLNVRSFVNSTEEGSHGRGQLREGERGGHTGALSSWIPSAPLGSCVPSIRSGYDNIFPDVEFDPVLFPEQGGEVEIRLFGMMVVPMGDVRPSYIK